MLDFLTYTVVPFLAMFLCMSGFFKRILSFAVRNIVYAIYCVWSCVVLVALSNEHINDPGIVFCKMIVWFMFIMFIIFLSRSFFFIDTSEMKQPEQAKE